MAESTTGERPPSKRTQRYKQQDHVDESKRSLLKLLGIGGAAVAIGGTAAVIKGISSIPGNPDKKMPNQVEEPLSPENKRMSDRLVTFNKEIYKNPTKMAELAPIIGGLAVEYFCQEMGYDPGRYRGRISYLSGHEYVKAVNEQSGCVVTQTTDDEAGTIKIDEKDLMLVNRDVLLYSDAQQHHISPSAAFNVFGVVIHELHHASSPIVDNPENGVIKFRGLGMLMPGPSTESKQGMICYGADRQQLEESVVQDSTDRMTEKLGFKIRASDEYANWVRAYRSGVIDRLFNGDHRALLSLQQQSKAEEFFALVGQKLDASKAGAADRGNNYLKDVILQGKY
jgi:hypothetical protein